MFLDRHAQGVGGKIGKSFLVRISLFMLLNAYKISFIFEMHCHSIYLVLESELSITIMCNNVYNHVKLISVNHGW